MNGYGGQELNDPALTPDGVERLVLGLDPFGVTQSCPTATTHGFETLKHSLATVALAIDSIPSVAQRVPGIHLEGPYISPQDGPRGAHPLEHVRPPDWPEFQRLQEAARGKIRILTMSPEYEGSPEFITRVVRSGVLVAIGHTAANSDQIAAAIDAGARMSTHLGNGAHGQIRRHPNYIWDQLADDRLTPSLIVDGHHLPPAVVKCFVRAKGTEHCVVVSDITGMAGMSPGRYDETSIGPVEVLEDGRLVVAGQRQYLAGAALPIHVAIPNLMSFAGLNLATAVRMATSQPAALIDARCGGFSVGSTADFVLFELTDAPRAQLEIRATLNSGELVYGRVAT
ncbi:MAG: amidohydrolase family protein [Planctomycetales bacterium]|nr:amidohydrolase family protein [Planctomycetales bacterium]